MKIRTAGVQDLETVSRIHALSWKTAYRGILPDDFLNQLSYRRWVAPLKDMMEQGLEIRVIEEEENPLAALPSAPLGIRRLPDGVKSYPFICCWRPVEKDTAGY